MQAVDLNAWCRTHYKYDGLVFNCEAVVLKFFKVILSGVVCMCQDCIHILHACTVRY